MPQDDDKTKPPTPLVYDRPWLSWAVFWLILAAGAWLRWHNLQYAIMTHPDERHMISVAQQLSSKDLNPHSFAYGSLSYYLLWLTARGLGQIDQGFTTYDGFFLVGRSICSLFGLASVILLYFLTKKITGGKSTALLSAAFLSFNFFHIQLSRYFTSDVILTALILAAILGMTGLLQTGKLCWYAATAITLGMAGATKISSIFLIIPLAVMAVGRARRTCRGWPRILARTALIMVLLIAPALLIFAACQPFALLDYTTFIRHIREQTSMVRGAWTPPYTIQYFGTWPFFYPLKQMFLYTIGWPVFLAAAAGFLIMAGRARRTGQTELLLVLSWVISFFLATAGFFVKFPRYLLPIYPYLFMFAGLALTALASCARPIVNTPPAVIRRNQAGSALTRLAQTARRRLKAPAVPVLVVLTMSAAFLVRFINVVDFPYQLHNDEMNYGLEGRSFLSNSAPPLFGNGWMGLPNPGFFLTSLFLKTFGDNLLGLRMSGVLCGLIMLLGLFWLTRLLFDYKTACLALLLAAFSHWHIHYSRLGLPQMMALAFSVWGAACLVAAQARKNLGLYLAAGGLFSIGCQVHYIGYIAPLAGALWLGLRFLERPQRTKRAAAGAAALLAVFCLSLAPQLIAAAAQPEGFLGACRNIMVFSESNKNHIVSIAGGSGLFEILKYQIPKVAGFFIWGRDASPQYGFSGRFFDPFSSLILLAGLLACLADLKQPSMQFLLLCFAGALVLFGFLAINPPFSPYLTALFISIFPLIALGLRRLSRFASHLLKTREAATYAAASCVFLGCSALWNLDRYFVTYPAAQPAQNRDRIARFLAHHPEVKSMISFLDTPEDFSFEAYRFMAPGVKGVNFKNPPQAGSSVRDLISEHPLPMLIVGATQADLPPELAHTPQPIEKGVIELSSGQQAPWYLIK